VGAHCEILSGGVTNATLV